MMPVLEAALWAFYESNDFGQGGLAAVNLGGDADSVGAIYGQLSGAYYGLEAIPKRWREGLVKHDLIESFAERLFELAGGT